MAAPLHQADLPPALRHLGNAEAVHAPAADYDRWAIFRSGKLTGVYHPWSGTFCAVSHLWPREVAELQAMAPFRAPRAVASKVRAVG